MAVVGQALATPEAGWQRGNNDWGFFGYVGTNWYEATSGSYYGGALFVSNSKTDYVTFKFYGTKLRIIGNRDPARVNDLIVNIDGTEEHYTEAGTNVNMCMVYEKADLSLGEHTVKIYPAATATGVNWTLDAFDIDSTGRFIPGTGSYLPRPEHGWKRYDEINPLFQRTGTWTSIAASAGFRGNRIYATAVGAKITFQFTGSKIRLVTFTHPTAYSKVNKVRVDGVEQTFTLQYMTKPATYIGFNEQMIVFEQQGLTWGQHTVEVECAQAIGTSFDAVDIDADGWLGTTSDMLPQRTQVDAGWKRIEATDNYMGIVGDWGPDSDANNSGGNCYFNLSANARIWFKFSGTKLRLIMPVDLPLSDSVTMTIDGVSYPLNFSRNYLQYQSVVFEKTDLPEGDHFVHVNGLVAGKKVPWDAIEIDAAATLKPTLASVIGNIPEAGWTRYQAETETLATMWGNSWSLITGTYSGSTYRSSDTAAQLNDYITFRFRGTGARLIGIRGVQSNLKVSINGGPEQLFYAKASGVASNMAITWEVVNLPEGVYDVRISKTEAGYLYYDALDIAPGGQLLPMLGSQYAVAETGWKRYDELMQGFDFDNENVDVWLVQTVAAANGGARKYTSTPGSKLRFTFTGAKLRLISYSTYLATAANDAKMTIDGVDYILSHNMSVPSIREQAIIFEKLDFTAGVHEVIIETVSTKTFYFDAVEVGSEEYINSSAEYLALLKEGEDIKTHVVENSVGKWITIGTGQVTDAMFAQGFNMGAAAAITSINSLTGAAQLYVKPKPGLQFKNGIRLLAAPPPQLVIGNDDIDISEMVIERISLANVRSGAGKVYMVLSVDSSATWWSFKSGAWQPVDMNNVPGLLQTAMTVEEVQALRQEHFTGFDEVTKMRFAYILYKDTVADRAETDTLTITVDLKGTWRRGVYGTEWDMDYPNSRTISVKLSANGTYKINY
ncbi:hypothetical protein D3C85_317800 [compost metagenome]